MTVTIVSAGMQGGTLTLAGDRAIREATLLLGAPRLLAPYENSGKVLFPSWRPAEIAERLRTGAERSAAVLVSGDAGLFSVTRQLLPLLDGMEVTVEPGVASPVALCAKMAIPWENMAVISLHGQENSIAAHVRRNLRTCFLLGGAVTAGALCETLCWYHLGHTTVYIGSRMGTPEEVLLRGAPAALCGTKAEALCTVVVENPQYCAVPPCGIADEAFDRSFHLPMTKRAVRSYVLSLLEVRSTDICWDIGCGTGSVSVELALHCPEGQVWAIDREPDALRQTELNARRFSCDNLRTICAAFPEAEGLPVPDKVFLGGTGGRLAEILDDLRRHAPGAQAVLTAVTLETFAEAQRLLPEASVTQLCIAHGRALGSSTMLSPAHPVWVFGFEVPAEEKSSGD